MSTDEPPDAQGQDRADNGPTGAIAAASGWLQQFGDEVVDLHRRAVGPLHEPPSGKVQTFVATLAGLIAGVVEFTLQSGPATGDAKMRSVLLGPSLVLVAFAIGYPLAMMLMKYRNDAVVWVLLASGLVALFALVHFVGEIDVTGSLGFLIFVGLLLVTVQYATRRKPPHDHLRVRASFVAAVLLVAASFACGVLQQQPTNRLAHRIAQHAPATKKSSNPPKKPTASTAKPTASTAKPTASTAKPTATTMPQPIAAVTPWKKCPPKSFAPLTGALATRAEDGLIFWGEPTVHCPTGPGKKRGDQWIFPLAVAHGDAPVDELVVSPDLINFEPKLTLPEQKFPGLNGTMATPPVGASVLFSDTHDWLSNKQDVPKPAGFSTGEVVPLDRAYCGPTGDVVVLVSIARPNQVAGLMIREIRETGADVFYVPGMIVASWVADARSHNNMTAFPTAEPVGGDLSQTFHRGIGSDFALDSAGSSATLDDVAKVCNAGT